MTECVCDQPTIIDEAGAFTWHRHGCPAASFVSTFDARRIMLARRRDSGAISDRAS